jgi:hypothetical protein
VRKVWNIEYDGVSAGSKDRSLEREREKCARFSSYSYLSG